MKALPLVAIGAVALLAMHRAKAAAVPATPAKKTADYFTPNDLAASLGGFVVGLTKGIATAPPTGPSYVQPNMPVLTGDIAGDSAAWLDNLDKTTPTLFGGGWSAPAPSSSSSSSVSRYSSTVDSIAAAPVYSTGSDFTLNPFALAQP